MRKAIFTLAAVLGLAAAIAPAMVAAAEHVSCDNVPHSEWAKCVLDQAADQGGQ